MVGRFLEQPAVDGFPVEEICENDVVDPVPPPADLFGVPPSGKNLEMEGFKIFQKGLTLLSSFTSVRNSYQAVALLRSGQVQVEPLISHCLPLEELPRALELIESRDPAVKKVIVQPNG